MDAFSSRLKATQLTELSKDGSYGEFRQICSSISDLPNSGVIKTQDLLSDCCQLISKVCNHYFSKTTLTLWCLCCAKSQWLQQPLRDLEAGPGAPILCSPPTVKEKYFQCIYLHETSSPKQTTDCRQAKPGSKSHSHRTNLHGDEW